MADRPIDDKQNKQSNVQDDSFTFGGDQAAKKVDAWDGENAPGTTDEAVQMSLANLHYGSAPEGDLTKSVEQPEETGLNLSFDAAVTGDTGAGVAVVENGAGAVVGVLSAFGPDAGEGVTYTVSDDRFEVVGGELRLLEGVSLDHEAAEALSITVTATNSDGLSTEETIAIDVVDVNEAPSDLALDGASVAENAEGAVVGTLSSFDPDAGDTVTYTVSDERFEVVDGELRLAEGVSLDHEEADTLDITVTATDSEGLSIEETFTIDVLDVNESPENLALDGSSVAENTDGAVVGTLSSFDPDADDTVTYTVSDDRFEVVGGELRLAEGVSLDHETTDTLDVTVTATDGGGLSTEETFSVDVLDVNEGPSDLELDNASVAENEAGAVVGNLSAYDPDAGDTITYTVSDDRFEVVDGELRLAEGVSFDHEALESLDVTVTATDSDGLSTSEDFTIAIDDVNEAPTDLELTRETSVAEADFSAGDGASVASVERLGLESDAIVFTMSFSTSDDVDAPQTLFETGGTVYGTNVVIHDGMIKVYAGEGNDLELSVPVSGDTTYSLALELDTANDSIKLLMSDELPLSEMNEANSLVASDLEWTDRDYTGSNGMGVGQVSGNAQGFLEGDFQGVIEGPGLQIFSDSTLTDVLSEAGLEENAEGAVVGTLSSFDPDAGDTVTYTVSDDRFEVVDGDLKLKDDVSLDHEAEPVVDITVTATDSGGLSTEETFTVDVIDVNEAPDDLTLDGNTVAENTVDGVVGTVSVSDPDVGDTHTYSLVGNDGLPFAIDAQTGEISVVTPGMPEGSVLRIDASDTDSISNDGGVSNIGDLSGEGNTIRQNDADERPDVTADGPFGAAGLQFDGVNDRLEISDDSSLNLSNQSERSFAMTIKTGDDVDTRQVIYEEGGTINGFNFYIDDGELYMGAWSNSTGWSFEAVSIDIEADTSYSIVSVYDGESNTYTGYVNGENVGSVEVGDVMSAHSGDIGLGGVSQHTFFHDGSSSANSGFNFEGSVGEFAVFNDALSSSDAAAIDMDFRGISADIDFETQNTYDLTVQVTDAAGESYQEVVTIDVTDLNEAPADLALDGSPVAENEAGAVIGTLSSFDPDADDTVTYTVSDDRFEVVDGELRLAEGESLDHEAAEALDVTVTATDGEGLSTEETFTVDVLDVNEAPGDLALEGASVAENETGAVVGTLSSFDPDAGDSVSYTVSDARFEVVDGELRLAEGVSLDHEAAASIDVAVTATDEDGLSTEETFTVDVLDVNEGPTDLALDGSTVAENAEGAVVGTLSSFDPDAGDTIAYTVSDDRFEVVDGELRLAEGVSLDHEAAEALDVTVTATDSDGLSTSEDFTITVDDVNEAPTDVELTSQQGTLSLNEDGGTDDNAISANVTDFPTDAITVEVTFTAAEMPGGSGAPLFSYAGDANWGNDVLLWAETSSGDLNVFLDGQQFNTGISNADVFDGEEHTVSFTWDQGSDELNVYVDGALEFTRTVDVDGLQAGGTITLGQEQDRPGGGYDSRQVFEGEIAEVRIYDQALSQDDIAGNAGGDVSEEGLVTNWLMDEAVDGVVADAVGNNDLVLENEAHISSVDGDGVLSVDENAEGAVVGTLSSFDPDVGDTVTYTVSDDRFEVVGDELKLKDDASLDHEEAESLDVTVTATDSGGLSSSEDFTINVNDVNEAPSDLTLTSSPDNFVFGGSFEGQNVNSGGWRGFASDETGNWTSANGIEVWDNLWGNSASDGNQFLELDYTNAADSIEQTVSTEAGQVYTLSFDAKARTSSTTDTIEVYWNGELVSAVDPSSTTWESVDFNVIGTGGDDVLEFREAVGESDSLGGHLDNISLVEATLTVAENIEGASVGMLSAFDPDAGDSVAYTVSDERFEVVDGELRLAEGVSLDHEATETVDVTVTATDTDGLSTEETFAISVEDVAEEVQLADGGVEYTESGVTETSVTGGDGDDTIRGGSGDDVFLGGAGDDLFIYEAGGGSDTIDGGEGWTDTIDLSAVSDTLGVYGEDWTVTLTEGEILNEGADALELSDDAAGVIDLGNGDVIDFTNIEQVGF
ncbi:MAG: LamG-like jellyroll fold domain-containing protein [Pseudomonadota bacterium]